MNSSFGEKTEAGTVINWESIIESKEQFLVRTVLLLVDAGVKIPDGTNIEKSPSVS